MNLIGIDLAITLKALYKVAVPRDINLLDYFISSDFMIIVRRFLT